MTILNEKNKSKILAVLLEEQGKAKERTIEVEDIYKMAQDIFCHLGISKKALEGSSFYCDPNAQDFPNAYKFRPMSTQFVLFFEKGQWRVDHIGRHWTAKNGCGKTVISHLSESAKKAILEKYSIMSI